MPIRRVGRDINAAEWWARRGSAYRSGVNGPYHTHRMSVVARLLRSLVLDMAMCVDFGCGDGILTEFLAHSGSTVLAIDANGEMCRASRERLGEHKVRAEVRCGGVEVLSQIDAGSVDNLFAINVLSYFTEEEQRHFYVEAERVIKPGGNMVVMTGNELFDMFTFNVHTVDFYERNLGCDNIGSLLAQPAEPDQIAVGMGENPLTYRYKLMDYGFDEVQREFANLHRAPPLLMDADGLNDLDSRQYVDTLDWEGRERWKLMFMCSIFGSRSVRHRPGESQRDLKAKDIY